MRPELLLIDDDLDDQEIFLMALEQVDSTISCVVVDDCTEALERLTNDESFLPRYIFLDINMHKISGIDCLIELKKKHHLKNSQIIMYSTNSDKKIVDRSKELGANDYLVKPPSITLLIESLTNIFKRNSIS